LVADPLSVFFTAEVSRASRSRCSYSEKGGDGAEPKTVEAVNTALMAPHTFTKGACAALLILDGLPAKPRFKAV
jgi:hypothetical protein